MNRPAIFLSSTVYDFRDLRSALKDYFESRGSKVFASDFNDFTKSFDKHSYDDCLATIEKCDVFVLLIGSRVGGLVDTAAKKSITRAEYEHAYKLAQAGRIRIVAFVRNDVWIYREAVKEMQAFLLNEARTLQEAEPARAPSKFMTDAPTIIEFIELVSRNAETSAASKGKGPFPIANWLHTFSTFADIRAAVDPLLTDGMDVSQALGRRVLLAKLTALLQTVILNVSGSGSAPVHMVDHLVEKIDVKVSDLGKMIAMDGKTWGSLVMLMSMVHSLRADASALTPALDQPLLFNYDPTSSSFRETDEQIALNELIIQIDAFNSSTAALDLSVLFKGINANREPVSANGAQVANALSMLIKWATMVENALALAASMDGGRFVRPKLKRTSPFRDQEAGLARERVTLDQVKALIAKRHFKATAGDCV